MVTGPTPLPFPPLPAPAEAEDEDAHVSPDDLKLLQEQRKKVNSLDSRKATIKRKLQFKINELVAYEQYGGTLTAHGKTTSAAPVDVKMMESYLATYNELQETVTKQEEEHTAALFDCESELEKEQRALDVVRDRIQRQRDAHSAEVRAARAKKDKEIVKAHQEEMKRYPHYIVKVTVEYEVLPIDAPKVLAQVATGKPRTKEDDEAPKDATGPSLRISYVVDRAHWVPKYEMMFDSISKTGLLTYRAEAKNETGEDWRDAKVVLSTAQTVFGGPKDTMPELDPWKIGIGRSEDYVPQLSVQEDKKYPPVSPDSGLFGATANAPQGYTRPVNGLDGRFGSPHSSGGATQFYIASGGEGGSRYAPARQSGLFGASTKALTTSGPPTSGDSLFGSSSADHMTRECDTAMYFGGQGESLAYAPPASRGAPQPPPPAAASPAAAPPAARGAPQPRARLSTRISLFGDPGPTSTPGPGDSPPSDPTTPTAAVDFTPGARMTHATSTTAIHGHTTTFTLPGTKTLASSPLASTWLISTTTLKDLSFTYTTTPKLRLAAYLAVSLVLPAPAPRIAAGAPVTLTIDGTYLGPVDAPTQKIPGDMRFRLGVDEAILVSYEEPKCEKTVKGLMKKEVAAKYTRKWEVRNQKDEAVKVSVYDQHSVYTGDDQRVGVLTVSTKGKPVVGKDGDVEWTVSLEPGEVKSGELVWEVRAPVMDGQGVVSL